MSKPNKSSKAKICQLTTGHTLEDERILHRMAWTADRMGAVSSVAGPKCNSDKFGEIELISVFDSEDRGLLNRRILAWIKVSGGPFDLIMTFSNSTTRI